MLKIMIIILSIEFVYQEQTTVNILKCKIILKKNHKWSSKFSKYKTKIEKKKSTQET